MSDDVDRPGAAATRPPLTPRQREVYDLIRDSLRRRGIAPALRELLAALGIDPRQVNAVVGHLRALEKKGYIRRHRGLSRGIAVVDEEPHPAAEVARLRAERDAYLAYAALLQMRATTPADHRRWTPEAAVAHAAEQATLTVREMGERGWSAGDAAGLMDCRDAVRERDSPEPPA